MSLLSLAKAHMFVVVGPFLLFLTHERSDPVDRDTHRAFLDQRGRITGAAHLFSLVVVQGDRFAGNRTHRRGTGHRSLCFVATVVDSG